MMPADVDLLPPPEEEELLAAPPEDELTPAGDPMPEATALVEILPADFPLPALIKFVPDPRVRTAADDDAARLLAIEVTDETSLRVMDACLERQRSHKKTIEALFEEPSSIANRLHKQLTGLRTMWLEPTERAIRTGGTRVVETQRRLDREAADARRKAQEKADLEARAQAAREAEAAAKANAPKAVVEQLQEEAKTAVAPPVKSFELTGAQAPLRSTSIVTTYKVRPKGTDAGAAEQSPCMSDLSPAQRLAVMQAMKAVLDGRAPIAVFEINYTYLNQRARADKKAFALDGFEVYEDGSTRGKGGRRT